MNDAIEVMETNANDDDQIHEQKQSQPDMKKRKELIEVVDWLSRAMNGEPTHEIVMIGGNPGEKKTALFQELLNELDYHSAHVIRLKIERIACSHQLSSAYDFYGQLIDLCSKASNKDDIVASILKEMPPEELDLVGSVFPAIYDSLGIDKLATEPFCGVVKTRSTPLNDHRLACACADLVRILTSELVPVVVLFEDLHWAGPMVFEFFTRMMPHYCTSPFLTVFSYVETPNGGLSDVLHAISESIPSHRITVNDDGPVDFENYLRLVDRKIENLSVDSTTVFKVASLLGIRFRSALLEDVVRAIDEVHYFDLTTSFHLKNNRTKSSVVQAALDEFLRDGLMAKVSDWYQFVDDAVYDAVLLLLDDDPKQEEMVFKVGRVLLHLSSQDPNLLLPCVIHLNFASGILPQSSPPLLAQLNLEAARQALQVTSFSLAVDFACQGLAFLGGDKWKTNYQLTLDLTTSLADMALADSDFVESKSAIDEIVCNARSVGDKMPVYYIVLDFLRAQGRFDEAIKIGHRLLPLIGETARYNNSSPRGTVRKLRTQLNKNSGSMCDRTQLTDDKKLAVCKLLHQLGEMAWMGGDVNCGIQMMCRIAQISLKNGPSQYSALAFANLGVGFRLHDYSDESARAGQLALALTKRFPSSSAAMTGALVYNLIDHWRHPFNSGVELLQSAYAEAQNRGSSDNAAFAGTVELTLRQLCGECLTDLSFKYHAITTDATMYGHNLSLLRILPEYQFLLNLTGKVRDVHVLTGDGMQEESYLAECRAMNLPLDIFYFHKMKLAYYFGSFVKANEYKQLFGQNASRLWCLRANVPAAVWFGGLIAVEMYKSSSSKAFLYDAKKDLKKMQKWVKSGAVNVNHMALLLEAEIAAATSSSTAPAVFQKAIDAATAANYVQDLALANERAAVNCLFESNTMAATEFMVEASRMYKRWGASTKVAQINSKYSYLFYDENSAVSSLKSNRHRRFHGGQGSIRTIIPRGSGEGQIKSFSRR